MVYHDLVDWEACAAMSVDDCLAEFRARFEIDPSRCGLSDETINTWKQEVGCGKDDLLDRIATRLASGFHRHELDFDFCAVLPGD